MNNLNITQNSNDLNESEKAQEKLYSNEASLDDLLTYSDDISQNQSTSRLPKCIKNINKEGNIKGLIDISKKKQIPIINSFNSEVTMSFLNNQNDNNINNKQYQSKSASKSQSKDNEKKNKNINKSCSDFKSISFTKSNLFDMNKNLKDISEIHVSLSNLLSDFEIKDISISKSINGNSKKNKSEKKNHNLNTITKNDNCLSLRSENLFTKKKEKFISNNQVSSRLNINNNEISGEQSNTNSMCNYQNISNFNEISINNNNQKKIIKQVQKEKSEKEGKTGKDKNLIFKNEISELAIKLNMSIDTCNEKKYKNEKNKYLGEVLDESEINKKDNFTTSHKKENNFCNKNEKIIKNSLKYTKAQCVNNLMQNNIFSIDNKIPQYSPKDNNLNIKDNFSNNTNQNNNNQKIVSLSPQKLEFEIEKNDCIQISIKGNCNEVLPKTNSNITYFNNEYSTLLINKVNDLNIDNNLFYYNAFLKKNNTTSFMISPNQKSNISNYCKSKSGVKKLFSSIGRASESYYCEDTICADWKENLENYIDNNMN